MTISFDPNYRAKLWTMEQAAETIKKIVPYVDVLIVNENQAQQFFGVKIPLALDLLRHLSWQQRLLCGVDF